MTDEQMQFEDRLGAAFVAYADRAPIEVDAVTLASVVAHGPAAGGYRGSQARPRWMTLTIVGLLLVALAATALWVGSRLIHLPYVPRTYLGEIAPTTDLLAPRGQPRLVTLRDGRVLILGGGGATAELFDPSTETGEMTGPMGTPDGIEISDAAMLGDGRVLVVGDARPPGVPFYAVALVFDPATNAFIKVGPEVTPRAEAKLATLSDGRVLMTGGTPPDDSNTTLASAEIFDPTTDTFSASGSMATSRQFHAMATLPDGRVLVIGGETADGGGGREVTSAEVYDPATGTFAEAGPTGEIGGWSQVAALPDGRAVVFPQSSGLGESSTMARIWDPVTNHFDRVGDTLPSVGAATLLDDGRLFLTGWWPNGRWSAIFDPASGTTTETGPVAGWVPSTTRLADGRVLIVGGLEDGDVHGSGSLAPPVASMQIFE